MIERRQHIDAQGASLLIGFSILIGFNQSLVKLVNAGFNPVFQAGLRSFFAFFIVLLFAMATRKRLNIRDGSFGLGVLNGCFFAGEFALMFLALDYTSVARLSLFVYTMPFFVAFAAHFMFPGEQLTRSRIGGLLLALVGVALALLSGSEQAGPRAWIGDLMGVGAALFWAALALLIRGTRLVNVSNEQNLLYQLAISALVLLAIAPLFGDLIRTVTPAIIGILAFQVVAVASAGFLLWIWILQRYPVSNMAAFSLLTPLFGVLGGWLVFDDKLTPEFLIALALVASGLFLMNRQSST